MAEKRSVPTALGIFIGPALAYLSYLVLISDVSEFAQLLCFGVFLLAGHDLARGGLSLTGVLAVLFVPAIPVAMYLNNIQQPAGYHLTPAMIIGLWIASTLLGAIFAGTRPSGSGGSRHLTRLVVLTVVLLLLVLASFMIS